MPACVWLPRRGRIGALAERVPLLREVLGRATRLADAAAGSAALLAGAFSGLGERIPEAALTRRFDVPGDHGGRWLRADPCHLRVEASGVRMLACGSGLGLAREESAAFAQALQPLFDEAGWRFDGSHPERWYLQPPAEHPVLGGAAPEQVLGAFVDAGLAMGDAGRATRQWLNAAQMVLHAHPLQAQRRGRGLAEVNSVWLHGDGVAPAQLRSPSTLVCSRDPLLLGCADAAGVRVAELPVATEREWLLDARDALASAPALQEVLAWRRPLLLQLESGERFHWRPVHRWRFWRLEPA